MDHSKYDQDVLSAAAAENLDYEHIPDPEAVTAGADKEPIQAGLAQRINIDEQAADNVERALRHVLAA